MTNCAETLVFLKDYLVILGIVINFYLVYNYYYIFFFGGGGGGLPPLYPSVDETLYTEKSH